jgi:hypothetical protein
VLRGKDINQKALKERLGNPILLGTRVLINCNIFLETLKVKYMLKED